MQIKISFIILLSCIFSLVYCQNEIDALKNEIANLEGKIRELEQSKATYKEIRMYKVRLFGKKQELENIQKDRPGIDKPIDDGLTYIKETFESFDKYSNNKELNSRFIVKSIEGRIMTLEGYVVGADFFPDTVESMLSSEIYENTVYGIIFNKTYPAAPKLTYHLFDMDRLCVNLNLNSALINDDIDKKILPYVRKINHEGKYSMLPHVTLILEGELKCEYRNEKPEFLYLDNWYIKEVKKH